MRHRVLRLAFLVPVLVLVLAGCAAPRDRGGQAAPAPPTTTAAPAPTAAADGGAAARAEASRPPGIQAPDRRKPAPPLRVTAFDGRTVTLEDWRGRPVVVSFFESWCPICRVEQPDLSRVADEFAGRVGFVGVSNHDTVAAGRAYQRRFRVGYPLANDASGRTWAAWRVPYQPVTVLVDKQGRIAERFDGGTTGGTLRVHLAYLVDE